MIQQKHKSWKRGLSVILLAAFLLQLSGGAALAQSKQGWYRYSSHQAVTAADLTYQGYDSAALEQSIIFLREAYTLPGQSQRITRLVQTLLDETDKMMTQYALMSVAYYNNVMNQKMAQAMEAGTVQITELSDAVYAVLAEGMASPYADVILNKVGYAYGGALSAYTENSAESFALLKQEQQLVQAYDAAYNSKYQVVVDGKSWTEASFAANPPEDTAQAEKVQLALTKKLNELTGETFRQLVQVRTRIAKLEGYDNYADYMYAAYGRDYTKEDSQKLHQAVKQDLAPLYQQMMALEQESDTDALQALAGHDGEQILENLAPYMNKIDAELGATFQFLRQYHLYDLADSPQKMPLGFTMPLYQYGSAYIYNKPDGTIQDYSTVIHEFGHFAAMFHHTEPALLEGFVLETDELQSQGLETLFCVYGKDLFADNGQDYTWHTLSNMLYSIVTGCMQDEFQTDVYNNPGMSLEEINKTYYNIAKSYGFKTQENTNQAYGWVYISHTFQSPCYYISYAVSALSAIDLYLQAVADPEKAADSYMKLSAMDSHMPYQRALKQCGLRNPFADGTVSAMADGVRKALRIDSRAKQQQTVMDTVETRQLHDMPYVKPLPLMPAA